LGHEAAKEGFSMQFQNVRRRKVHEDVAHQIEEAIILGSLVEGRNLPSERDLMASFGVGRPAIREALLLLGRTGFLQLSTGGRARITRPTVTVLVDQLSGSAKHLMASTKGERAFQEARRVFEAAIARNAAEIATDADVVRLGTALEINRAAVCDMAKFQQTDVAFHLVLAEIGTNPVFGALHGAIAGWLSLQRKVSLRVEGAAARALSSHQRIYEAVAERAPERAWAAMDAHLREVMLQYEKGKEAVP